MTADEKLALLLMKQGSDSSPIAHWTQGGARVASALAGVIRERRAQNRAEEAALHNSKLIQNMLGGLNGVPPQQQNPEANPISQPQGPSVIPAPQVQAPEQTQFTQSPPVEFAPPPMPMATPDGELAAAPAPYSYTVEPPVAPPPPIEQTQSPAVVSPQQPETPTSISPQGGVNIAPQDIKRLAKLVLTESIPSLPDNAYNAQSAGIIDTALNRVQANIPRFGGNDLKKVLNAPYQFSDINGPVSWQPNRGRRTDVDQISDAMLQRGAGAKAMQFAGDYLNKRSGNAAPASPIDNQGSPQIQQIVDGHLNYANPHFSDAANMRWISKLDGPRLGAGNAIHHHGTAAPNQPINPQYAVNLTGQQQAPQSAPQAQQQAPIFIGDSHAAPLAQFAKGQNFGQNGATIAQGVAQLQSAPQGANVVLSAGTNDAVGQFNPEAIRAQVAQAAQIAKAKGINLTWAGPTGPKSEALDALLAEATGANGINYRSVRNLPMAMQKDGIHAAINQQGYGAMLQAIQQQPAMQNGVNRIDPNNPAPPPVAAMNLPANPSELSPPVMQNTPNQLASLDGIPPEMLRAIQQQPSVSAEIPPEAMPQEPPQPAPEQLAQLSQPTTDFGMGQNTPFANAQTLRGPSAQQQLPSQAAPVQSAEQRIVQSLSQSPQSQQGEKPINPAIIRALTSGDPTAIAIGKIYLQKHLAENAPKDYEFGYNNGQYVRKDKRNGRIDVINPYTNEIITDPSQIPPAARNIKRGLNPIYGQDKDGKPILLQTGDDGVAVQTQLPNGVTISTGVDKVDAGTHFVLLNKKDGSVVGTIPKNIAGAAEQQAIGKGRGQAIVNQPKVDAANAAARSQATIVVQDIDEALKLINTSWLPTTGAAGNFLKNIGGTGALDVSKLLDTVKSAAALDKVQAMRAASTTGAALGNVSDKDMDLLKAAIGNLEQSQSKDQLVRNLERVKTIYQQVIHGPQGAQQQAPATAPVTQQQQAPATAPTTTPPLDAIDAELKRRGLR